MAECKNEQITCDECDWTDTSTGDKTTDAMLRAAHYGEAHTSDEAPPRPSAA